MKKKQHHSLVKNSFLFVLLFFYTTIITAQNVGIGTSNPIQKLHVAGNTFISDSLYIGSITQPQHILEVGGRMLLRDEGTLYGSAGTWFNDNNNSSSPAFIGLYDDNKVGLYGNKSAWSFTMNTTDAYVGIGNNDASFPLDISGRMRIQSINDPVIGTAGIWMNKQDNAANAAGFMGMYDDNKIGVYGTGVNAWLWLLNTNTGNMGIGNTNPQSKLDITGNMLANGNIQAGGNLDLGIQYVSIPYEVNNNGLATFTCNCPAGTKVISGGNVGGVAILKSTAKADGSGWLVLQDNCCFGVGYVWAFCAKIQ
jgi:hypothetical protein